MLAGRSRERMRVSSQPNHRTEVMGCDATMLSCGQQPRSGRCYGQLGKSVGKYGRTARVKHMSYGLRVPSRSAAGEFFFKETAR